MSDSPTTPEPQELNTAKPPEPKTPKAPPPFQFTIGSMILLTAVVAIYFALVTQAPDYLPENVAASLEHFTENPDALPVAITFFYLWFLILVVGFCNLRKYWKGFLAANIPFLQVLIWQASYPITGIAEAYYSRYHLYLGLVCLALVLSGLYLVVLIFVRGNLVEKVVGGTSAVLHFWVIYLIVYDIYDWVMIYGISIRML